MVACDLARVVLVGSENQLPMGSAIGNITHQTSQIVGFVTGAAVVATIGSYRTLGIDALTFGISALILLIVVRPRPAAARMPRKRPTMWSVSADGIRIVFGDPVLRTLLLLARFAAPSAQVRNMGWLAMASCTPLVGCAWSPPLPVVLTLWLIAGAGGAFQIAAAPMAVSLAGLLGLCAAAMLAMSWTQLRYG